jgi:hypothetical protein
MLDSTFLFSQHSLSDFADCPRRFFLRYVAKQSWPLVESSPIGMETLSYREELRRGAIFHQWVERYWLGVEQQGELSKPQDAKETKRDDTLAIWKSRFLAEDFSGLPSMRLPELELVAPLGDFRLYARFDLLASEPNRAVIVDWKTLRGENPPSFEFLKNRIQTRAYLYVLARASAPYHGGLAFDPEQISMRYWLANFPERLWVEIPYSRTEYEADKTRLQNLAQDAARRKGEDQFEKTSDERKCKHCSFRTLCHRKSETAFASELDEEARIIDLNDIEALEY